MNQPWRLLALLLVVLGGSPLPARAADDEAFRLGAHALRRILHDHNLKPLRGWAEVDDPASTVLVLMGNGIDLDRIPGGLADFLDRGGAVLIATDRPLIHHELTQVCNHGIGDQHVRAWPIVPRFGPWGPNGPPQRQFTVRVAADAVYQEQVDCLILQPTAKAQPDIFWSHDEFGRQTRLLRVATNRPSYLAEVRRLRTPATVTRLAYLPAGAWYGFEDGSLNFPVPAALHARHGRGQLLLFSDHSIFINEMMLRHETRGLLGNLELADNAISLFQGDGSPRTKALMIHDGDLVTRFDVPIVEIPLPLREVERMLVANADNVMAAIQEEHQEERRLDEELLNAFDKAPWLGRNGGFYFLLALVATLGFCLYGLGRLVRASHTLEPSVPLFARAQSQVAPTGSVLEERLEAMAKHNNYAAVARAVAHDWFAKLPASSGPPQVEVKGGWWQRWQVRRLVRRLWTIAHGQGSRRISAKGFQRLLTQLEDLDRQRRRGDVQLR